MVHRECPALCYWGFVGSKGVYIYIYMYIYIYSPSSVNRIWLRVYNNKISIYPIFYLLKGDYLYKCIYIALSLTLSIYLSIHRSIYIYIYRVQGLGLVGNKGISYKGIIRG